jgi:hypothetical protein
MHTLPVKARFRFTGVATISFPVVVPVSRHFFSIAAK